MNEKTGLAIDLGGTKIAAALFDANGIASPVEIRYLEQRSGSQVGELILELAAHFLGLAAERRLVLERVGVAVPGIYYSKTGKAWAPNIPGWEDYPLYSELTEVLEPKGIALSIDSDRACYILGEAWKGAARGCQNAIFLAVGTGIGAGILVDGRILRGANDIAGAIGWLAVTHPYLPGYETYGCFEYHASGLGIARMAREILAREGARLKGAEQAPLEKLTAKDVFVAYEKKDPNAAKVIQRSIEFWGKASANLVSLFNPEKIIFGGGVFGPATAFIDDIYLEAKKWAQPISIGLVSFEASQFGSEAGLYGAGYLALRGST
ncbi:MAG: ROK family protein [Phaeodactylibacter sp.]|nr:ROK family protein [Phaeodactylibacter sp.]MCB9265082.1 ROK family protein [Lewinellaceae bacterium]MCB9287383.1 ROK family protein [Lewinellaceae bacterium]